MASEPASYKQSLSAVGLSLERHTKSVPSDGFYYVLLNGEVKGRFKSKAGALALYRDLLKDSGYTPPPQKTTTRNEDVEGYLDAKELYWGESHKHTRRGGKGRY